MKNKKIPNRRNISKIQYKDRKKRQNQYSSHTNTSPLTFLALYRHLIKSGGVKLVLWTETLKETICGSGIKQETILLFIEVKSHISWHQH
jgi:hypothetical protein